MLEACVEHVAMDGVLGKCNISDAQKGMGGSRVRLELREYAILEGFTKSQNNGMGDFDLHPAEESI